MRCISVQNWRLFLFITWFWVKKKGKHSELSIDAIVIKACTLSSVVDPTLPSISSNGFQLLWIAISPHLTILTCRFSEFSLTISSKFQLSCHGSAPSEGHIISSPGLRVFRRKVKWIVKQKETLSDKVVAFIVRVPDHSEDIWSHELNNFSPGFAAGGANQIVGSRLTVGLVFLKCFHQVMAHSQSEAPWRR